MNHSQSAQLDKNPKESKRVGNLIVFTGPSGVGKGTIVKLLLNQVPQLVKSVSVTTRKQRVGELEGIDYYFCTSTQFKQMKEQNQLMEWAEFASCFYGTPKAWVEAQLKLGNDVLLEIEVEGAKQIRQRYPQAVLIFVSPPSFAALKERLCLRATESSDKIALRLNKAKREMDEKYLFQYEVINDNIDLAVQNLVHIVYAERCRIPQTCQPTNEYNQNS